MNYKFAGENLAVFDLDGTLWEENSHIHLVETYYKISKLEKVILKIYGRLFPEKNMDLLNKLFNDIPSSFIKKFEPTYNVKIVEKLEEYKSNNWQTIIVTNAPARIADLAADIFGVEVYCAEIGKKRKVIEKMKYNCLHVVSDNISDYDIIQMAKEAVVLVDSRNVSFFKNHMNRNITLIDKNVIRKEGSDDA